MTVIPENRFGISILPPGDTPASSLEGRVFSEEISPEDYRGILSRNKMFLTLRDRRGIQRGDMITFTDRDENPGRGRAKGSVTRIVSHVQHGTSCGLMEGWVVIGLVPAVPLTRADLPLSEADALIAAMADSLRGNSARTMASHLLGKGAGSDHPHDATDFARCEAILTAAPSLRGQMGRVAAISPAWAGIVKNWDAISRSTNVYNEIRLAISAPGS